MNASIPPGAYVRIRNASSPPFGPCPLCEMFAGPRDETTGESVGRIWKRFDVPMPPYHPDCKCWAITYYPSPEEVVTELPPMDLATHNALVNLVISYILAGYSIPALLQPYVEEAEQKMRQQNTTTITRPLQLAADTGNPHAVLVASGRTRTMTNAPGRLGVTGQALQDAHARGLFDNLSCFADHADWHPSVRNLVGLWINPSFDGERITATLQTYNTDHSRPVVELLDQIRSSTNRPDIGVSIVFGIDQQDKDDNILRFSYIESADIVIFPAVPAARFFQAQGDPMTDLTPIPAGAADMTAAHPDPAWNAEYNRVMAAAIINQSDLPALVKARLQANAYPTPDALNAAIDSAREELAALHADGVINLPGRPRIQVVDPLDQAEQIAAWIFGAAGAPTPPANMRRIDDWYRALTGDVEFRGVFDRDRVQFAGATTSTLADMAANVMNKVMVQQFLYMDHWRWFERIVSVEPNDGTLNPMKWITLGGVANLPTVAEGAAYTELSVGDVSEADSFTKYGGYVGITRELIKNSDIQRMQAIPRALAAAALRTRSAAVSAIFTTASGVGPTLEQDSVALFNAAHSNLATTALGTDATAWRAARAECFKHAEVTSSKRLGIYPRYLLVPAELYDVSLSVLGYGEGMPTTYTPEAQDRGFADPRAIPLVVPDWTDATDWAYIVDPQIYPVIQMSYSQNPGGRNHPTPELYAVTSEQSGLLFANDTLPIKVRDEFAVGVNGPRGIGKRNVA